MRESRNAYGTYGVMSKERLRYALQKAHDALGQYEAIPADTHRSLLPAPPLAGGDPFPFGDPIVALQHAHWMVDEAKRFTEEGELGKAERWLCFAQGIHWFTRHFTIDEMREHNR